MWTRNVQTPAKYGRPEQDRCILSEPKHDLYVRDPGAVMTLVRTFGQAYAATTAIETPARKQQVALESLNANGVSIHTSNTSENWPDAVHQKTRGRKRALSIKEVIERNGASTVEVEL